MKPPPFLLIDTVGVETYRGKTSVGTLFEDIAEVACSVEWKRRIVINRVGADRSEIISEATLWASADESEKLTLQSRVTVDGKVMRIISTTIHGGLAGPEQVEAVLA